MELPLSFTIAAVSKRRRAFSLLEVVIAIGVCAGAVVSAIVLHRTVAHAVTETRDAQRAARVVESVQAELDRLPWAVVETYLTGEEVLYASADGSTIAPPDSEAWHAFGPNQAARDAAKFHAIQIQRDEQLSPSAGAEAGSLVYILRVSWPAFLGDGRPFTDHAQRSVLVTHGAITR